MKIGFFLEWMVGSMDKNNKWNVVGEELIALSWCKELQKIDPNIEADIYSYNKQPQEQLDLMVYMNYNTKPIDLLSKKRLLYIENEFFNDNGNLEAIYKHFSKFHFDGILSYSHKACKFFENKGFKTYYFPFSVDTDLYKPVPYDNKFDYDIAYVGSNIKGAKKTKMFMSTALKYNLGLFGNWKTQIPYFSSRKNIFAKDYPFDIYDFAALIRYYLLKTKHRFNMLLCRKSQGKISNENMVKLLSSSKICFNMTLPGNQKLDTISYRILEAFACKGFVISDYCPTLEENFGDAIVTAKNKRDLSRKVKYYMAHPEERKAKAEKGYKIVQEHFTAKQRSKELYDIIMEYV